MFNPLYPFTECVTLDRVEVSMLPYKPPILSQIFVPTHVAENMLDYLIKRFGSPFDTCVKDVYEPDLSFDVFQIEVEFDTDGSIMYADSRIDDSDERINLFRI